ncbi:hypothetical protein P1J78_21635 [Psychromarinibacter sp. C21-152]|uniref:Uncharacterized protein n=1 Tax=Psychromarinibacter sediminicola TaxID=3033385 RepID=A0AAE3TBV9_9RHOB|nr:hypothetical protein [Psychromarinibacter sediminicola]MDF0603339.1 hypothetical protein [Psychromarinibacter sediminicola]
MTAGDTHTGRRGGTPVGYITELDAVSAAAVLYFRLWCEGAGERAQVESDFRVHLGPEAGRAAVRGLSELCALCARHGRRPLMRHGVTCRCLGGDECCFATLVGAAAEGDREDALMLAMTMIRADMAPAVVGLAEGFGLALKRMALAALPSDAMTDPKTPETIH